MKAEHFGISIVEMMAAGIVVLADNSAGPKYDIIQQGNNSIKGYLCETDENFVDGLIQVMSMKKE